jgi:hypothetical protein
VSIAPIISVHPTVFVAALIPDTLFATLSIFFSNGLIDCMKPLKLSLSLGMSFNSPLKPDKP